jgi:hypothetical protein
MSGLLSMRRAAAPRHSSKAARVRPWRRLDVSRAAALAKSVGLVAGAVVVLFSAVLLLLTVASWASDRNANPASTTTSEF